MYHINFRGDGSIPIVFAFHLVGTRSKFYPETNHWMWEFEDDELKDTVRTYIDNNKIKYGSMKNVDNKNQNHNT